MCVLFFLSLVNLLFSFVQQGDGVRDIVSSMSPVLLWGEGVAVLSTNIRARHAVNI